MPGKERLTNIQQGAKTESYIEKVSREKKDKIVENFYNGDIAVYHRNEIGPKKSELMKFLGLNFPGLEHNIITILLDSTDYFFLYEKEDKIIAASGVIFYANGKIGYLFFGAVDKQHRGLGLGKKMLEERIKFLKNKGLKVIATTTKEYRVIKSLEKLSKKYGYKIISGYGAKQRANNILEKMQIEKDEKFPLYHNNTDENLVRREYLPDNPTGEPIDYEAASILKDLNVGPKDGILFILIDKQHV